MMAGEHPMWGAKQMGHADWTMIARIYGKWMPDADKLAGSRAEAVFGISGNKNISISSA
jgi:integrase